MPAAQTCLLSCTGARLTVSNCTITLVNQASQPFSVVRAEGSQGRRCAASDLRERWSAAMSRRSSIWVKERPTSWYAARSFWEATGRSFGFRNRTPGRTIASRPWAAYWLAEGRCSIWKTSRVRSLPAGDLPSSVHLTRSMAASRGLESPASSPATTPRPASAIASNWLGDQNVYCGWKGFFASGADRTIRVPNLAAFRSTWNRGEESSLEILIPWLRPPFSTGDARRPGSQPAGPGDHTQAGGRPPAVLEAQDALDIPAANHSHAALLDFSRRAPGRGRTRGFQHQGPIARKQAAAHKFEQARLKGQQERGRFSTWFLTPTHRSGMATWVSSCAKSFPRG